MTPEPSPGQSGLRWWWCSSDCRNFGQFVRCWFSFLSCHVIERLVPTFNLQLHDSTTGGTQGFNIGQPQNDWRVQAASTFLWLVARTRAADMFCRGLHRVRHGFFCPISSARTLLETCRRGYRPHLNQEDPWHSQRGERKSFQRREHLYYFAQPATTVISKLMDWKIKGWMDGWWMDEWINSTAYLLHC